MIRALIALMALSAAHAAPGLPRGQQLPARVTGHISAPQRDPMNLPTDIAVDRQGQIIVVDGVASRLLVFSPEGALKATWTGPKDGLEMPVGVGIAPDGHILIADTRHHRVVELSAKGAPVQVIALPKGAPRDVAATRDRLYVSDGEGEHLWVGPRAGPLKPLGAKGPALGQFLKPFALWIGPDGYVFVSEVLSATVQRITPDNRWSGRLGRFGLEPGHLYRPKGIAGDGEGRLFVADSTMGVVQAFDVNGGLIGVLSDAQGEPLRFNHPMGIAYHAGRLYVVEQRAHRVAVVALEAAK
ncbi:NHL repeat-containing protein [Myxococcota bacterium]|nr:NHL repeat-containing protein [Myxococcota bacterium]MBU1430143.1 NHL repeat-containing protein [Myxococcota bacterium]MBU1900654.1 NHL repeat-containing protein [Myxococcota bacterium]